MNRKAYLGIDLGTTSVKCMALDAEGRVCASAIGAYPSYMPHTGWVEQEPGEWMKAVYSALGKCAAQLTGMEVAAISFSGHMSSPVFLGEDDEPLMRCITISDIRSAKQTEKLMREHRPDFERTCGNRPLDCFGASKLLWFQEERQQLYAKTKRFVFAKDYVRGRLTGLFATDPTDAGNSLLYDFSSNAWNEELIRALGLEPAIFPKVVPATSRQGELTEEAARKCGLAPGIPVICGGADMACSQLGTGALHSGLLVVTLSTTGQICMHVPAVHEAGIGKLTFHQGAKKDALYAMASVFSGGLSVNWMYQMLFNKTEMTREDYPALAEIGKDVAKVPPGANGVSFLPFLTGSGSPRFDTGDCAVLTGLSCGVAKPEMLRAAMEGVAYNIRENISVFESMGARIGNVRLGGGGTKMAVWSQIIADVLGCDLSLLNTVDASAIGACILARSLDRGVQALEEMSDEIVTVGSVIPHCPKSHRRYDRLYRQYQDLCDFMSQWQKKQVACLGESEE